jgi:polyhydroxyalkanoate synthesis regulator phasin
MGLGDLVQKAVYLGIGVASYAGEKAGVTSEKAGSRLNERFNELREQMQKMADEMVDRGEMTAADARKFVDDMVQKAQQSTGTAPHPATPTSTTPRPTPRSIEIEDESTQPATPVTPITVQPVTPPGEIDIDTMRRQVQELQDELRRLRKN